MKVISIVLILFATVATHAKSLPEGKFRTVAELCADGQVYAHDADTVMAYRQNAVMYLLIHANNKVGVMSYFKGHPELTGAYLVEYTWSEDGLFKYGKVLKYTGDKGSSYTSKKNVDALIASIPTAHVSASKDQLVVSYPGFDGGGRCPGSYVINIYQRLEKKK